MAAIFVWATMGKVMGWCDCPYGVSRVLRLTDYVGHTLSLSDHKFKFKFRYLYCLLYMWCIFRTSTKPRRVTETAETHCFIQYIPRIVHMVSALLCFVVISQWPILPIHFWVTSQALGQSYDYPSAFEATLTNISELIKSIQQNFNHNKRKHDKSMTKAWQTNPIIRSQQNKSWQNHVHISWAISCVPSNL